MKLNLVTVSLGIFTIVVVGILIAGFSSSNNNPAGSNSNSSPSQNQNNQAGSSSSGSSSAGPAVKTFSADEVGQHSSQNNCWLIINDKVYDVTNYMNQHPGMPETIAPYCGKEATQAFDTKGGMGRPHSGRADSLLNNYYVGDLKK